MKLFTSFLANSYDPTKHPFYSYLPMCPFSVARVRKVKGKTKGLYCLFLRGRIVYVGWSTDIQNRIYKHRKDKVFDEIAVLDLPYYFERMFIIVLKPLFNIRGVN